MRPGCKILILNRRWKSGSFFVTVIILFSGLIVDSSKSRFDAGDYVSKHEHFNHILRGLRIAEGRGKRNMDIDADVDQYSIMRYE